MVKNRPLREGVSWDEGTGGERGRKPLEGDKEWFLSPKSHDLLNIELTTMLGASPLFRSCSRNTLNFSEGKSSVNTKHGYHYICFPAQPEGNLLGRCWFSLSVSTGRRHFYSMSPQRRQREAARGSIGRKWLWRTQEDAAGEPLLVAPEKQERGKPSPKRQ